MSIRRSLLQILSSIVILTMLFSGFSLPSASAQGKDGLKRQVNAQTGKVSFLGPESGRSLSASRALGTFIRPQDPAMALAKRFGTEFGLKNPEWDLKEMKNKHAEDGHITARYQQKYEGIPVMGGELIVNTNENADLYSMNGEVSPDLSLSTQPTIDSEQAKQTALQAVAKWYQKPTEDFLASKPELWIYDESLLRQSTRPAELVWQMEVTPKDIGMPMRELVLVNAQRGNISLHFNQIDTAWSFSGKTSTAQAVQPTSTPQPTETPLPPPTSEPAVTATPTEETKSNEDVSVSSTSISEVTTLTGTTWYVATTGSDSNACSAPASPCRTINAAVAKAVSSSTIMVASGTYTSTNGSVVTLNKSITLSGGWDNTFSAQSGASIIDGGGVRNGILADMGSTTVVIDHFVVQNSHADTDGGGIYISGVQLILENSSIINNTAGRGAGLFITSYASASLQNTTISGNRATSSGGGIYVVSGGGSLYNSTVAYNSSGNVGGGITRGQGAVSLQNSIVAKNSAAITGTDCYDSIESSGYNIIGTTTGCAVYSHPGDLFNVNPLIDASLTGTLPLHALQAGSPAIDAGDNCLAVDQRGLPRPEGVRCDIGSYEYAVSGLTVVSGSSQSIKTGATFALPFTVSVRDGSLKRVAGVTVTFTAPATGASGIFADTGTRTTTVVTNTNGVATTSRFTANTIPGAYTVTASASGSGTVSFSLQNYAVKELYVSTTGNDSNSCSNSGSPCKTINAAIEKARDGDTIKVAVGTYTSPNWVVVEITN